MTDQEYAELRTRTAYAAESLRLLADDLIAAYSEDAETGGDEHYCYRVTLWASYGHVKNAMRCIHKALAS